MDNNGLRQQIANMRQSFFNERLLNKHFLLLEDLERDNPNFVENILRVYFSDNAKLLTQVEEELEQKKNFIDFATLERLVIKFKGSSGTVGAHRVTTKVAVLTEYVKAGNIACAKVVLPHVKMDQEILRNKMETYFQLKKQLKKQIPPAETPPPVTPKSDNEDNEE